MHSVSPSSVASATNSTAARPSRRSGHSMMSSGQAGQAEPSPLLLELAGRLGVDVEVHRPQVVRGQGAGVLQCPGGGGVETVHQDHDDMAAQDRGLGDLDHAGLEQLGLLHVLVVQPDEADIEERPDDHDEPRALLELGHGEDQDDAEGEEGREAVDGDAASPVRPRGSRGGV